MAVLRLKIIRKTVPLYLFEQSPMNPEFLQGTADTTNHRLTGKEILGIGSQILVLLKPSSDPCGQLQVSPPLGAGPDLGRLMGALFVTLRSE
jgi:hypothetical protein